MRRTTIIGTIYKLVILNQHILYRPRFIPSGSIALYKNGTHARITIGVVTDNHSPRCGNKRATRAGSGEKTMPNVYFGRTTKVLYAITLQANIAWNGPHERHFYYPR